MVTLTVNTAPANQLLSAIAQRQLPFATSLALNRTANLARDAVRGVVASNFILRKPQFILGGVAVLEYSTKANPGAVVIGIKPRSRHLWKFEQGGMKRAPDPDQPIAIPTRELRPNIRSLVPQRYYPKFLGLQSSRLGSPTGTLGRRATRKGRRRTQAKAFILDPAVHRGVRRKVIVERVAPGSGTWGPKKDLRTIWLLKTQIPIPKLLPFRDTVQRVLAENWQTQFAEAFATAIRTAK